MAAWSTRYRKAALCVEAWLSAIAAVHRGHWAAAHTFFRLARAHARDFVRLEES